MIRILPQGRVLHCEALGCRTTLLVADAPTAQDARDVAYAAGWVYGPHPKADRTVDLCPQCARNHHCEPGSANDPTRR